MWHQLNVSFSVSCRIIQWQIRCHLLLSNLLPQLIDVCRANQSHLTGLNTLVARPPSHSSPFCNPCQSSVEADWTPAPCLPPRKLFCSNSESLSCAVLSKSSCTTNEITKETLDSAMNIVPTLNVLSTTLRGQVAPSLGCNAPPSPGCLVGCCAVHCTMHSTSVEDPQCLVERLQGAFMQ